MGDNYILLGRLYLVQTTLSRIFRDIRVLFKITSIIESILIQKNGNMQGIFRLSLCQRSIVSENNYFKQEKRKLLLAFD